VLAIVEHDEHAAAAEIADQHWHDVARLRGQAQRARNGDVDELCYRSESPLEPYWVIFGSGPEGDYQTLTQIRVVFSPPPGVTCPPSAHPSRPDPSPGTQGRYRRGFSHQPWSLIAKWTWQPSRSAYA